jgi:hypothetical protein
VGERPTAVDVSVCGSAGRCVRRPDGCRRCGENDRQVGVELAVKTYDAAVNSSRRELKITRLDEGGAEHCHIDNPTMGNDYHWSWTAEVLGALPGGVGSGINSTRTRRTIERRVRPLVRPVS